MASIEINLHPNQYTIYNDPHRFKVIPCGRRFGKSLLASRAIAVAALNTPNGMFFLVAPVSAQTSIIWRMIIRWLPKQFIKQIRAGDKRIELKNGAYIWAKSGDNPDTLRGEGLDGCILDECAMLKKDVWTEAIRPSLADKKGWCWMISTPKGKNWFYQEYLKGKSADPKYKEYASFKFTSYDNPFIAKSEIDAMAEELPDIAFRQEIMAEFIEGGGIVFENFLACIKVGCLSPYQSGRLYMMGVDLGRHQDFNVIMVGDLESKTIVYFERWTQMDWTTVESRIRDVYDSYGSPLTYIDSTGKGEPIYERLLETGVNVIGININQSTKPMLVRALKIAFDRKMIFIPDIDLIKEELAAYAFTISAFSNIKYGAPEGFHDDTVIALALLNYGINGANPTIIGMPHPDETTGTIYDEMENIESWDTCILDLEDDVPVIPELQE